MPKAMILVTFTLTILTVRTPWIVDRSVPTSEVTILHTVQRPVVVVVFRRLDDGMVENSEHFSISQVLVIGTCGRNRTDYN